jgi:hypothetical protein
MYAHVLEFLFFDQQAIESLPGGALLGGACEDCNFKDDDSPDLTDIVSPTPIAY